MCVCVCVCVSECVCVHEYLVCIVFLHNILLYLVTSQQEMDHIVYVECEASDVASHSSISSHSNTHVGAVTSVRDMNCTPRRPARKNSHSGKIHTTLVSLQSTGVSESVAFFIYPLCINKEVVVWGVGM